MEIVTVYGVQGKSYYCSAVPTSLHYQWIKSENDDNISLTFLLRSTCTHSAAASNNYWRVDLGVLTAVSMVKVYNRKDCCQSRIGGAKVYVGEQFCDEIVYAANQVYTQTWEYSSSAKLSSTD